MGRALVRDRAHVPTRSSSAVVQLRPRVLGPLAPWRAWVGNGASRQSHRGQAALAFGPHGGTTVLSHRSAWCCTGREIVRSDEGEAESGLLRRRGAALLTVGALVLLAAMPASGATAEVREPGTYLGQGVDACSAPSSSTTDAWLASPYRAIGVHVGGINRACTQPKLTATWVAHQEASGWHLLPIHLGLQASCTMWTRSTSSTRRRRPPRVGPRRPRRWPRPAGSACPVAARRSSTWRPTRPGTQPAPRRCCGSWEPGRPNCTTSATSAVVHDR